MSTNSPKDMGWFDDLYVVSRAYKFDPIKDEKAMQRWSAHSLRIGVCVIPHSMGLSEPQLQQLLRWRSSSFMVYIQNTAILANLNYIMRL